VEALVAAGGFQAEVGDAGGAVSVRIAAARPDALFGWIETLEGTHGLRVTTAEISRNEDATLSSELTLGGPA
ncbi:MAG: hypothetical protein WA979_12330, partial [Pacificimonas sp.]